MAAQPNTFDLLRRTVGAFADLAAKGTARPVRIGEGDQQVTARLEGLDIEPSRLWTRLDPTSSDHGLAQALDLRSLAELPPSDLTLSRLVAPWREGARAAVRATSAVTRAVEAAAAGVFEMATAVRLGLREVHGATWTADKVTISSGPVVVRSGLNSVLHCFGIRLEVELGSDDIASLTEQLPVDSVRFDDGELLVRPRGRLSRVSVSVEPVARAGRIALVARSVRRGRWSVRLPGVAVRHLTWWIDAPSWLDLEAVSVGPESVIVTGKVDEWVEPVSLDTVQKLVQAAQHQGQDLVLPRADTAGSPSR